MATPATNLPTAPPGHVTDPRAEQLLDGSKLQRVGFKALAILLACDEQRYGTMRRLADRFDVSRQFIYRGLDAAAAAGFEEARVLRSRGAR